VLEGRVMPGSNVLLLDDLNGWWPASGTALHLAQQRHLVTVATAAEKAAGQLDNSQTGDTTRERFAKLGIEVLLATGLVSWQDNTARLMNLYTGDIEERQFDSLVLATTNDPEDRLSHELAGSRFDVHTIGDAVQARTASMAIFEARKLAMTL
jgi:NADPH-dependent 2,4-dienoyl-CoA reductase/sulfur reductase-like enzyme